MLQQKRKKRALGKWTASETLVRVWQMGGESRAGKGAWSRGDKGRGKKGTRWGGFAGQQAHVELSLFWPEGGEGQRGSFCSRGGKTVYV